MNSSTKKEARLFNLMKNLRDRKRKKKKKRKKKNKGDTRVPADNGSMSVMIQTHRAPVVS